MKCIIQIPCWNEEKTLAQAIEALPRNLAGIDEIEVVVIDDGSHDRSVEIAREQGVSVVALPRHVGLAETFVAGVEAAIERGGDVLVNFDADLQYPAAAIPSLIEPILAGNAEIVIGDRLQARPFSPGKMALERFGTFVVRAFSGCSVTDAASGFRAFNREALEEMFIHGKFSYTLESLVLAGMRNFRVVNIPVSINGPTRQSRLFKSIPGYLIQSAVAIIRAYLMYYPLKFMSKLSMVFLLLAAILGGRFIYFFSIGEGGGHIQSLILVAILAFVGFQTFALGLLGDVLSANRRLLEKIRIDRIRTEHPPE